MELNYVSAAEALSLIKSNSRVFLHGSACTPVYLLEELAKNAGNYKNVELVFISLQGPEMEIAKPEYADSFHVNSLFVSAPVRGAVNSGFADFVPVFLSDIPDLFNDGIFPIDVAIIHVTPPDDHGYCSMGVSVDIARAAVNNAKKIIALVNPRMPRTMGDGMIHYKHIDKMVFHPSELPEVDYSSKVTEIDRMIGRNIAEMVEDGSTLQLGIGTIPDSVLTYLGNHKDLGVHTEMLSDGIIDLFLNNVINNRKKRIHPNRMVTSFALGTRRLYDFVDNNAGLAFLDIDYVNNPSVIAKNDKVVAINSCIEIDLTGQVCSDSIGTYQYSGIGGQMDFIRGAALSKGGKPIIAINSRTRKGQPRIVPTLKPGAGVVTSRGHVRYVVTEYGVVNLFGLNMRQRAKALIEIAHPDDREMLHQSAYERFKIFL
ncbi:MAG TPA: acetyl-CoA hydrolase/transferase C-terminal domain-containing protein [Saprospiraceae bacterium]|jgi:acyl-CoA hydrolase|nr:acetyl-CoA hydrolase/transferase family protein [Saprospiraceae bacterium]MBX7180013.1 4-hydroxybutyrate CoA-transferase [Saprospiraceae bacterium]MCB0591294.1 acetyl-CoA hydrolase/transferase family protein [Saprospiraceae bacterium]MCO5283533.1 4-hydroxybutyrate CoA-transferase [Saprospiraceae bacterium]MCO6470350.1 acetyl-CoA hydrolase/transferase family protein [Saprospiraceae bacterium]